MSCLEEVYIRNIKETLDLLFEVSKWGNMSSKHQVFRNIIDALYTIRPEDLTNLAMLDYLAMVNKKTGSQLEQITDFNLRSLLFCELNRRVWTKLCHGVSQFGGSMFKGSMANLPGCHLKDPACYDCLNTGCKGYLVELETEALCEGIKRQGLFEI